MAVPPAGSAPISPVGRRILVIEDDEGVRDMVAGTLAGEGNAVTAVADGAAALDAIDAVSFALVVADVHLPGALDGRATLRRARLRQPWLRCLFTSGFEPAPVRDDPEADDFIAKPFRQHELLGCVFELLQRRGGAVEPSSCN
jgi:DNA-binding response OmpR family regulator